MPGKFERYNFIALPTANELKLKKKTLLRILDHSSSRVLFEYVTYNTRCISVDKYYRL